MSSTGQSNQENKAQQPAEHLLEHLLETIHIQLKYAKKMDAEGLKEATGRRQDLLFQLELEVVHAERTEYLVELQQEVTKIDDRLMAVLEVVNEACRIANPSKTPETYTAKGTISGYKI